MEIGTKVINKDNEPGVIVGEIKGQVVVMHKNNTPIYTNKAHLGRLEGNEHNNY